MDDEAMGMALLIFAITFMIVAIVLSLGFVARTSPLQQCIKAGYEWRGGDCVMGVDHD
jgi:hypothetical protein